jgi:Fe-S-cluster containining protein
VPVEMTAHSRTLLVAMKGTDQQKARCVALEGAVGGYARCIIYENRPSVCREFAISGQDGQPNEMCDQARKGWGLPSLSAPKLFRRRRPRTLIQV